MGIARIRAPVRGVLLLAGASVTLPAAAQPAADPPQEAPAEPDAPAAPPPRPEVAPAEASVETPAEAPAEAPTEAAGTPPPAPQADAELRDIEAALAADQADQQRARGETEPSSPPADSATPAPAGGSGSLGNQSMNPDLSLILDVAGAWFTEDENLQTGGHDPTVTGFNLQQLELSAKSVVDPYFRFDGNLVFSQFGVEVEEAYGTTLDLPLRLQLRFGQFLTRFGRINPTHPHSWDFVDQPFAIGRVFGSEGNRGLGAELSWLLPLPWYVEVLGSATHAAGGATARSFYGNDDLGVDDPTDLLYVTAVKQFYPLHDDWSLFWGLSGAFGPNSTGRNNRTDVYGTDLYLKYRPITRQSYTIVSWQTEVLVRRRQVPADLFQDFSLYTQLFWRFAQRWGTAARYEYGSPVYDIDANQVAGSEYQLDPEWNGERHRVTSNVTFWPTEFSRLRLQGSLDLPEWRDDPIGAVFLAVELVTGAHGAHAF